MSTDVIPQFDEYALDCEADCRNHCIDSASLTRLDRYCMVSPTCGRFLVRDDYDRRRHYFAAKLQTVLL